jgi:hypothetical protein
VVPRARQSEGAFLVEYGRSFKIVAGAAWLIAVAIAVICFLPSTGIEPRATYFIAGGFFVLALFLHSEFFFIRITYSIAGVKVNSRWGGHRRIAWPEIDSVSFSKTSQNYVVKLYSGEKFTFNYFMSGYQSLLEAMQERVEVIA